MTKCVLTFNDFKSNITLDICGSKSISQRALIINFLNNSNQKIINLSNSLDTQTLNKLLKQENFSYNVKDGGTTLRFLLCVLSLKQGSYFINGSTSLKNRPLKDLIINLRKLGVSFEFQKNEYQIPLFINGGGVKSKELIIDSEETSQFASALSLIAPYIDGGLKLIIKKKIASRPFFDMTIKMMKICGAKISDKKDVIVIKGCGYDKNYSKIESDWTSVSYIYEIVAFSKNKSIVCSSFCKNSLQGDSDVINFFNFLGVKTLFNDGKIILTKYDNFPIPKLIKWDVSGNPDLALTYITSCLGLGINLQLTGIRTLLFKESNRLKVMKSELEKFNVNIILEDDFFFMDTSSRKLEESFINTYFDHRIALAFAPLVIITKKLNIEDYNVVSKSYPQFWDDLKKIGIKISSKD
tara:strand:+ start:1306 stop:2538 length:1233 start_codon:yes stop_codon:yes gene_type:complete